MAPSLSLCRSQTWDTLPVSSAASLGLEAELALLLVRPGAGGYFGSRRGLAKAFGTAGQRGGQKVTTRGWRRTRRRAIEELKAAELIDGGPRGPRLLAAAEQGAALQRLRQACADDALVDARDISLLSLLAIAGALPERTSRDERRSMARRLRQAGSAGAERLSEHSAEPHHLAPANADALAFAAGLALLGTAAFGAGTSTSEGGGVGDGGFDASAGAGAGN